MNMKQTQGLWALLLGSVDSEIIDGLDLFFSIKQFLLLSSESAGGSLKFAYSVDSKFARRY